MRPKDPTDPLAWLARAKGNLNLAEKGGRLKGVLLEDLCFNAQQAAEKALKAVCLHQGMDILESRCTEIPKNVREADILTQYAVQSRYPSIMEEITRSEYRDSLRLAANVVFWAEMIIK
jgi:HEPN domain-containing protein